MGRFSGQQFGKLKNVILFPPKKLRTKMGSIRFIEMISKNHSIKSLATEVTPVLAMYKYLENG
jgi:hypothetical protein